MQTPASSTPAVPHYRIEDPVTEMCIRLHSVPCDLKAAPRIVARLDRKPTRFTTLQAAQDAFQRYCPGEPLEIARVDA